MATETEILEAAKKRLAETSGLTQTIRWPGQSADAVAPRYDVAHGAVAVRTMAWDGMTEITIPFVVTAVTRAAKDGDYTLTSNTMVDRVVSRFAINSAIGETGAWSARRPQVGSAYVDGGEYRVPITMQIRAYVAP